MSCKLPWKSPKSAFRPTLLLLIVLVLSASACTYSFSNLQLHAPAGVNSIAIAPIFDTSRRILPHGHLWESLQREGIQSGKIALIDSTQADVQLRAQIISATSEVLDERRFPEPVRIPLRDPTPDDLANPGRYEDLKSADRYTVSQALVLTIEVEVWDLRSKTRLLAKRYSAKQNSASWNEKVPPNLRFIRAEESFEYLFASVSDVLARQVVTDFLSL